MMSPTLEISNMESGFFRLIFPHANTKPQDNNFQSAIVRYGSGGATAKHIFFVNIKVTKSHFI